MAAASDYPNAASGMSPDDQRGSLQFQTSPTTASMPPSTFGELDGTSVADTLAVGGAPATGPGAVGGDASPVALPTQATNGHEVPPQVQEVLQSEIGIVTMLNRLKQSIGTAKEFALFLKKRAQLEEDYSAGMRKLARSTQDSISRTDPGQGSSTFGGAFGEMMDIHSRMADNGYQFSTSLHQMHEDLLELAMIAEKNRKGWKQTGLAAEQRVADLETATRKSKAKYDSLAEEYDRARTGDASSRRGGFGFKGPKSAAQLEEDLLRKVQASDEDYHSRVDTLSRERAELLATGRPEIIKALQDLVRECDGGMVLQVQKYASFSEKLLLSNGLSISPIKSAQKPDARSLREVVTSIDTERDLNNYLSGFQSKVPAKTGEPKYERHAVLGGSASTASQVPALSARTHTFSQSVSQPAAAGSQQPAYSDSLHSPQAPATANSQMYGSVGQSGFRASAGPVAGSSHERSFSYSSGYGPNNGAPQLGGQSALETPQQPLQVRNSVANTGGVVPPPGSENVAPYSPASAGAGIPPSRFYTPPTASNPPYGGGAPASQGPPQLGALPFQTGPSLTSPDTTGSLPSQQQHQHMPQGANGPPNPLMQHPPASNTVAAVPGGAPGAGSMVSQGQPSRPMFGVSLDTLYERDSVAVPLVVYQCIQAVDLFGLTVEGIYRLSGSLPHVNKLKSMFDTDSSSPKLDFRNPENFFHDVNSVAGLLKQFFRDLPDPLLTRQQYDRLIEAAQHEDDTVRRDSLHAVINDLPDPNYATLRALILHLNRVVENAPVTRMTSQNLAIVFGPTLMGAGMGDPEKARWHVRVIDTILQNTYQIFDED
ncbi:RhoGAP group protein [Sporothrix brasiliensis 5110]|uniref:RhoGAP group protein n=1 Tax=Sporothrix brasiliensis 5110 TaxID=1398154 RepID=A0A0C2IJB4_9PEZI|nr:RhoGAP group protein [Sporothrix brasiliensis 5110]KIH89241.1 RhoGAP group protein [Sporothrix brasiliensis 5110]